MSAFLLGPRNLELDIFTANRDQALKEEGGREGSPADLVTKIGLGLNDAIGG